MLNCHAILLKECILFEHKEERLAKKKLMLGEVGFKF